MPSLSTEDYANELKDKVVIVTGAASGFGKLLSERLVEFNAKVLLVDINLDVEQVSDDLNIKAPKSTHWVACDICNPQSIQGYFAQAINHFGRVDVVVNNAGIINKRSLFDNSDHQELERLMRLNLFAPMESTRVAVRYFQDNQRQGVIINTASIGGLLPVSIMGTYGTTKAGLIFFTASCKHLAPLVRVNAVAPYFADTQLVSNSPMLNSYPLILKAGLVAPEKVVESMLTAICDQSLAGDTLMVTIGKEPKKLTIYDQLATQLSSYVVSGLVKSYTSMIGTFISQLLNKTLGWLYRSPASN
ncbi:hypothetical protein H4R22_002380 [Coemansia sp. RSA 1290]|nr:hypothetical protein H4R22_002380 [Coemansia sp. RSA 1290]KAJ2653374.1 hypothetical protein IWW40_000427 [Coemansia sp. RSA 1250]